MQASAALGARLGAPAPRPSSSRRVSNDPSSRPRPRAASLRVRAAASEESPAASSSVAASTLADAPLVSLAGDGVRDPSIPTTPGVYAIYDADETCQYVGLSRKVSASVKVHAFELPRKCAYARCVALPDAAKQDLQLQWKAWMVEHLAASGGVLPPGNAKGNELWTERKNRGSSAKPNLRLTDGEATDDQTLAEKCREAVDAHEIVAFIKGSRKEPECGFSHRMCAMLDELMVEYETIDALDERHNHNLRNVLKTFSDWPTIPQLYHAGELVGGHDIVEEMHESGELRALLVKK
jgi:Grx4 family monothiol glutaredoxin